MIYVSYETVSVISVVLDAERYARQLTKTCLFYGLSEKQIREWLNMSDVYVKEYEMGSYLFNTTDTVNQLGIVLRGSADVMRQSRDGMMHMSTLRKNDLFGAASLFGESELYVTDIRCNEPVRVLIVSEGEMFKLLCSNSTVLLNYLRYLNARIRFLNKRLDAFSKNTVSARVMTYLSDEANNRIYNAKNLTKLSETLCVSRATLYRALEALESSGQIRREGKQIIILED